MSDPLLEMGTNGSADIFAAVCVTPNPSQVCSLQTQRQTSFEQAGEVCSLLQIPQAALVGA